MRSLVANRKMANQWTPERASVFLQELTLILAALNRLKHPESELPFHEHARQEELKVVKTGEDRNSQA